jgi:DNA-directed RNA polymerase subunit F
MDAVRSALKDPRWLANSFLDAAMSKWADSAEVEIANTTGDHIERSGTRCRPPKYIWKSILPEKVPEPTKAADAARSARDRETTVDELRNVERQARAEAREGEEYQRCREAVQEFQRTVSNVDEELKEVIEELAALLDQHVEANAEGWNSWEKRASELSVICKKEAEEMEKLLVKERVQKWRGWVENGYNQGARNAHAATKTPTEWQPTTVQEEGGG